jgi:RNA polymerase sigma-70 factor (ECF subfamily)
MEKEVNAHMFLVSALAKGDEKAFDYIFRKYYPKMKEFIAYFCVDSDEAEDVIQNVFMDLWIHKEHFTDIRDMDSYLFTVSKNAAFRTLAKSLKTKKVEMWHHEFLEKPSQEESLFSQELEKIVQMHIDSLPEKRRRVFMLSRMEGKSNEEIAAMLNISKRTVEKHISDTLAELRKLLTIICLIIINNH